MRISHAYIVLVTAPNCLHTGDYRASPIEETPAQGWGSPCGNGWKGANQTNRSRHSSSSMCGVLRRLKGLFVHYIGRIELLLGIAFHAVLQERYKNALLLVDVRR